MLTHRADWETPEKLASPQDSQWADLRQTCHWWEYEQSKPHALAQWSGKANRSNPKKQLTLLDSQMSAA